MTEHPLIAFLRARLDEREAAAAAASEGPWTPWRGAPGLGLPHLQHGVALPGQGPGSLVAIATASWLDAEHIAMNDPAFVLADIAAKRKILDAHDPSHDPCDAHDANFETILCDTVLLLIEPFASHPDYPKDPA